ncbi:MAG: TolC family protein [Pirellulaceae bacterium]|nr:TolC family protein [Pirellulaceae bacterium]
MAQLSAIYLMFASGCISPLERSSETELREMILTTRRTYREAVTDAPVIELERSPSDLERSLKPEHRVELDRIGGPNAFEGEALNLGDDLLRHSEVKKVTISLQYAIQKAARNNLDVQFAQIQPAVREAALTQAKSVFDAIYFATFRFDKLDTPLPATTSTANAPFGTVKEDTRTLETGIRKTLTSGGQMTLSTRMSRNERVPSFFETASYYDANILLGLTQPLLRGFGQDVTRAQIMLAGNAKMFDVQQLRRRLVETVNDTETAYWNLVLARQRILIQQRLLSRTIVDRDKIKHRLGHDATPVEYTEANSFVESRRADLILAQNAVRTASDSLKRLINSPDLSVADETQIVPVDKPVDGHIEFNVLDVITSALQHRPEIRQVLLNIQDASIRQRVADNARLPQLDLAVTMRYNGIGNEENVGDAQEVVTNGDFIDYLVSLQFEVPLGNRGPKALYRQRQLEQRGAVIAYQNIAQQIVQDTKNALRDVIDAFRLIRPRVDARLSSADNLRALDAREEVGDATTPEFLDLRMRRLGALADAEMQEMRALTSYQITISNLYLAMGTLLERNGIQFSEQPLTE